MIYLLLMVLLLAFGIPDYAGADSWRMGQGLGQGDAFDYHICDERFHDRYTGDRSRCYNISLYIANVIDIRGGTLHLVTAATSDYTGTAERLFLINPQRCDVKHIFPEDADYADSLQGTILWRNTCGIPVDTAHGSQSVLLERGNMQSALTLSDVIVAKNGALQYTAIHDSFESSHFTINEALPLPVSSEIFTYGPTVQTARHLFSFEMRDYSSPLEENQDSSGLPQIRNGHFEVNRE